MRGPFLLPFRRTPESSRAPGGDVTIPAVFTIGHSTRTIEEFVDLLRSHAVQRLIDVRTVPRSRRNPQFSLETLPETLKAAGIAYIHTAGLGGLRRPKPESVNAGWRNSSFRGFADYMQTPEFEENLETLIEMARRERVALMCAEAVPWRCHRSLIADALAVRGFTVQHIISRKSTKPHQMTAFAKVEGTRISYPAAHYQ